MKILVVGAAGMIGRKLTERLVRDGEVGGKAPSTASASACRRSACAPAGRTGLPPA